MDHGSLFYWAGGPPVVTIVTAHSARFTADLDVYADPPLPPDAEPKQVSGEIRWDCGPGW